MDNLFRITKNNVNNCFIEYNNKKQNDIHKLKSSKILKSNTNNLSSQNKIINKIDKIYNQQPTDKKFNCDIKKINDDEKIIKINNNQKNNNISKNIEINNDNIFKITNNLNQKNNNINDKKIIFEYGKSCIKVDILKKSMKFNLNILILIDKITKNFLNFNKNIKLNKLIKNNDIIDDRKIHDDENGKIIVEANKFINIIVNDKLNNNLDDVNKKKYNLIDFGYVKLYDIKFTEEFINKQKIPMLNSIMTFSDNIHHFLKLIKLFSYTDKYKIKINQFGNYNMIDVIKDNIPSIILNLNDKKNIFNTPDKKYTFYIKILQTSTSSFIIDKENKIICYFNSINNNSSGYIFFYVMHLDSKYKIINFNKQHTSKKIKSSKKKQIKKSSSISDFTDDSNFL